LSFRNKSVSPEVSTVTSWYSVMPSVLVTIHVMLVGSGPVTSIPDGTVISSPGIMTLLKANRASPLEQLISTGCPVGGPPLVSLHMKSPWELKSPSLLSQELSVYLNRTVFISVPTAHCLGGGSISLHSVPAASAQNTMTCKIEKVYRQSYCQTSVFIAIK
jgi:hypothetical protein